MLFDVRCCETTSSTNDDALQAALEGAQEGVVIWALSQTSGRGRQGRTWSSPRGNLYASVVLRPSLPVKSFGLLSFVSALAISDAITAFLPAADISHKWPNDVLVSGKKISGVLLEAGDQHLVLGVGINVLQAPHHTLYPTTTMAAEGVAVSQDLVEAVLTRFLQGLDQWYSQLQTEGFSSVREAWLARAKKGELTLRQGDVEVSGQFRDIDPEGNLRLIAKTGQELVFHTGDVFF